MKPGIGHKNFDAIDAFSSNCLIYHLFKFSQLLSWTRVPRGLASTSQRFIELLNMNEALADFRLRLIPQESRPFSNLNLNAVNQ